MKPTIEILTRLQENSKNNHDEVFTKLFRYLLRPDIYYVAFQNLYANNGAGTRGVDDDTADGFSEDKVNQIIEALENGTYEPKPVRRTYIKKKNGKMRPLGLPAFTDKLVQDIIRMVLQAIYEPVFSDYSHGFRPGRSCHTPYTLTPEYKALQKKRANTKKKIERRNDSEERNRLIADYIEIGKELRKTPAKLCNDKKLKYARYADDFLIAVNGSKADCEMIKAKLTEFIRNELKMELSQEKTLITHSNEPARFLGYDVRVRRDQQVKPWKNCKQRTMTGTIPWSC